MRVWIMHQENNISNKNDIFQICSTAQITHFMVEYSPRRGKRPHLLLPPLGSPIRTFALSDMFRIAETRDAILLHQQLT